MLDYVSPFALGLIFMLPVVLIVRVFESFYLHRELKLLDPNQKWWRTTGRGGVIVHRHQNGIPRQIILKEYSVRKYTGKTWYVFFGLIASIVIIQIFEQDGTEIENILEIYFLLLSVAALATFKLVDYLLLRRLRRALPTYSRITAEMRFAPYWWLRACGVSDDQFRPIGKLIIIPVSLTVAAVFVLFLLVSLDSGATKRRPSCTPAAGQSVCYYVGDRYQRN